MWYFGIRLRLFHKLELGICQDLGVDTDALQFDKLEIHSMVNKYKEIQIFILEYTLQYSHYMN